MYRPATHIAKPYTEAEVRCNFFHMYELHDAIIEHRWFAYIDGQREFNTPEFDDDDHDTFLDRYFDIQD